MMNANFIELKNAKDRLETNIKDLLYIFEKSNSFIVTSIKVDRHFIENANLKRNILYDVKVNITL